MSLRILCTLSLLVTTTKAVIVDVTPSTIHQEVNDVPYALVYIHKGEKDTEDLSRLDINVFASSDGHPDFQHAQSDIFVVVRGIVAPYVGDKSKDMLVYLADRLPTVYDTRKDIPNTSMTLVNGDQKRDQDVLELCIHTPELSCYDAEEGPLVLNNEEYTGETSLRSWTRSLLLPPIISIADERLYDMGMRMFDKQLIVFSDDELDDLTSPEGVAVIQAPENHPHADVLGTETPGAVFIQRNRTSVHQESISMDNLKDFIATI